MSLYSKDGVEGDGGHVIALGRGGFVRHGLVGDLHLTGCTTFERGGSEPEGGWLYVGL